MTSSESKYLLTTFPAVMAPSRRMPGPPGDLYACHADRWIEAGLAPEEPYAVIGCALEAT